jgi:hypothetical protein
MPNAKDIPVESRLFAFFVGDYDAGKSTAVASFGGKKYFLDFDGRIVSLRGREDVDFDTFSSETKGFEEADKAITMLQIKAKNGQNPYNVICLDSISMGRRLLLYDAMKFTSGIDPQTKKQKGRSIGKLSLPTMQDYGYESEAIWQLVMALKEINCNIVVTAHSVDKFKKEQAYEGGPVTNVPDGKKIYGDPQLIAVLPILFTEIYYFTKEIDPTGKPRRFVEFDGDIARTTYPELAKAKKVEITDKSFYEVWKSYVNPPSVEQKG